MSGASAVRSALRLVYRTGPGRLARPYPVEDSHLLSSRQLDWRTLLWVTST
jgi:hypothetical protein